MATLDGSYAQLSQQFAGERASIKHSGDGTNSFDCFGNSSGVCNNANRLHGINDVDTNDDIGNDKVKNRQGVKTISYDNHGIKNNSSSCGGGDDGGHDTGVIALSHPVGTVFSDFFEIRTLLKSDGNDKFNNEDFCRDAVADEGNGNGDDSNSKDTNSEGNKYPAGYGLSKGVDSDLSRDDDAPDVRYSVPSPLCSSPKGMQYDLERSNGSCVADARSLSSSSYLQGNDDMAADNIGGLGSLSVSSPSSSSSWSADDHAIFTKTFRRVQLNGTLRKVFITTLRSHLPHKSMENILSHEDWYRRLRSAIISQNESTAAYEQSRSELISQAKDSIESLRASLADNMKRNCELQLFEKRRTSQHERLLELRMAREEKDRIIAEKLTMLELEIEQKQREDDLLNENERALTKVKVLGYKNQKEILLESQRKLIEEEKQHIDEEIKREIESKKTNVQNRRDLLGDKELKRKLKEVGGWASFCLLH